jgi:hypothetical protein
MPSTQTTSPLLEKSIVGSDEYGRLKAFWPEGMIDAYQQLQDFFSVWTRFIPTQTVDYEVWTQWIYQNSQQDANKLQPENHMIGTAFPLASLEEPYPREVSVGGYANRIHIPAKYWRFHKGPDDPILHAREILLTAWIDFFAEKAGTDITNDYTSTTDGGEYDSYLGNATGGYNTTQGYNQVTLDSGYEFDADGDPVNFFTDLATVINAQGGIRGLNGRIPMRASECQIITDSITLGRIKKKFINDKIYYDRVTLGEGFTVPEVGGFTFMADDAALLTLSKTFNGSASTKGFGLLFMPRRVPFYSKQYFLGAKGWTQMSTPNADIPYGMETYFDNMREGDIELLFQSQFKNVVLRPDEMFILGNLRAN